MKIKILLMIFIVAFATINSYAQIDNEANFYTAVANANYNKDLVLDYGVDNDFATDDSASLQSAINDVSANGGGVLSIPAGNYTFEEVDLKSNVHIEINENVVIRPTSRADTKNYAMFILGENGAPIVNVSMISSGGDRFTVDLTQVNNINVTVFRCRMITNFLLANCNVLDIHTKFSAIAMGGEIYGGGYLYPENGIVKDMDTNMAHYGYGMVQTQSAENILFKDLSATGGATLRLETGATALNDLQGDNLPPGETRVGGLNNIVARNISCTNGNSALMVSPHAVHNGTVDAEGITAVNSGFAARIEGGFVAKKYDETINLDDGTFEFVRVKNVIATYGDTAELKSKHFKHYPPEIPNPTATSSYDNGIYIGPSIAPVLADTNYTCTSGVQTVVVEEPVVGNGFLYQEDVIPDEFVNVTCSALLVDDDLKDQSVFELFPNPSSNYVNVKSFEMIEKVAIHSASGKLIIAIENSEKSKHFEFDVSLFTSGLYVVKVSTKTSISIKKLIVK